MRLHFQRTPWDLYIVLAYTAAVVPALLGFGGGSLALLLIFLVPGYVLVAAIFPGANGIDWIERLVLSIVMSIAVVALLGLALNFSPFGVHFVPIVVAIGLFTVLVGLAAYTRRMSLSLDERLSLAIDISPINEREPYAIDKVLTIVLAASLAVALGSLGHVILSPRYSERYTEFYLLGPSGNASGYPTHLNVSQTGLVIVGLANYETVVEAYTIRIDLVGVQLVYNATTNLNDTVEANRTTWSWFNVTLGTGLNWSLPYFFSIPQAGLWELQFNLYRDGILTAQRLHLFIRVS